VSTHVTTVFPRICQRLDLSIFTLECIRDSGQSQPLLSPASSTISEASTAFSALSMDSTATAVAPYVVSDYERITYYHGISLDPPELLYRSDLHTNSFPVPKDRHSPTPTKTVHGVSVFNTRLNEVWHDVAPQICKILKARDVRYSAVKAARFFTHGEDGKGSLGPIVVWIASLRPIPIPPPPRMRTTFPPKLSVFSRPLESREP
jgi:hypothetical protein